DVLRFLAGLVDQRGEGYQEGGDEFVLILPNLDEAEAVAFAEKVRSRIASQHFQVGDKTETITISGGFALWPKHGETKDAVLVKHPASTFPVRVTGDSMIGAGIHSGDLLIVDRSLEPRDGSVVIAILDGELTVKRLERH